jgi:Zn-dependent protease
MTNISLPILITRAAVLLLCFPVHEFAHAWTADYFGDYLPRSRGRVTLNPLVHLDVMGSLMLMFTGFGWAKPVPVTPYILQMASPRAPMLVALSGPLSNFLLALVAAIPLRTGLIQFSLSGRFLPTPYEFLYYFVLINLVLFFLNLLPLAPLDGFTVAMFFLPESGRQFLRKIEPYSLIILVGLFISGIFGLLIRWPVNLLMNLLVG